MTTVVVARTHSPEGSPGVPSSLSAVGSGVLGVTVKDGTSGGKGSAPPTISSCFFGGCGGDGGGDLVVVSSSPSTRLSTSLCEWLRARPLGGGFSSPLSPSGASRLADLGIRAPLGDSVSVLRDAGLPVFVETTRGGEP